MMMRRHLSYRMTTLPVLVLHFFMHDEFSCVSFRTLRNLPIPPEECVPRSDLKLDALLAISNAATERSPYALDEDMVRILLEG